MYLSVPHTDSSLSAPASAAAPTTPTPTTTPAVGNPGPGARRMVAIFDYDPRESSPNTDIEVWPKGPPTLPASCVHGSVIELRDRI